MLTSQGTLRNHYSLVLPAQLISDITKYKRKPSGKFKEKKRKRSHDSQSGPKTKKRERQREDSNEISESSSSESSVCKTGHKTTEKKTLVAQARVTSKRPHVQKTLTHFSDHEQQSEMPSTVAIVPSDSSGTHFACDTSIDVYKYGHSKRIYRYRYQWLSDEIPTATCEPSEIAMWERLKFRPGT